MKGQVTEGEETEKLISQSNASVIYMSIDILPNYEQNVLANQELMLSRNAGEGLRVLWKIATRRVQW